MFCFITNYDITIGNDVAREIIMGEAFIWAHIMLLKSYNTHVLCITVPNYDISVFLVKSLKLYIKY